MSKPDARTEPRAARDLSCRFGGPAATQAVRLPFGLQAGLDDVALSLTAQRWPHAAQR